MRIDMGTVTVASAGTARQLSAGMSASASVRARSRVLWIEIHPRSDNTGAKSYFGRSNVSSTYGREILKGVGEKFTFGTERVSLTELFNTFYVDSDTNGDEIDFVVAYE